jgi:hypothetical protein
MLIQTVAKIVLACRRFSAIMGGVFYSKENIMPHRERTPNGNIIAFIETSRLYFGLANVPAQALTANQLHSSPSTSPQPATPAASPRRFGRSLRAVSRSLLFATGIGAAFGGSTAFAEAQRGFDNNQKKLSSRTNSNATQTLEKTGLKSN